MLTFYREDDDSGQVTSRVLKTILKKSIPPLLYIVNYFNECRNRSFLYMKRGRAFKNKIFLLEFTKCFQKHWKIDYLLTKVIYKVFYIICEQQEGK